MKFDHSPPKADSHCYPIVRCRPTQPIKATLLQRSISGIWTHYWNGRTIACVDSPKCEACDKGIKDIWCGYIIARRHDDDKKVMLAVTRAVKTELDPFLDGPHRLHGLRVKLIRVGHRKTSPIKIEIFGRDLMDEVIETSVTIHIMNRLYADNANKKPLQTH